MFAISQKLSNLDDLLLPHYPWLVCVLICLSIYFYRASSDASRHSGPPPPYSVYLPKGSQLPLHYQASAYSPPLSPPASDTEEDSPTSGPHPIFHTFMFPRRSSKSLAPHQFPPRRKHSRKWSTGKEYFEAMDMVSEEEEEDKFVVEIKYKSEQEARSWSGNGIGKRSLSISI